MSRTARWLGPTLLAAVAACGPATPPTPDAALDAADGATDTMTDAAPTDDAPATTDGAAPDARDYSHTAVVQVRDFTVATASGAVPASHITIRAGGTASQLLPGRCAFYADATAVAPPALGPVTFFGLNAPVNCTTGTHELGIAETICLPTSGAPLTLHGSVLAPGPLIMGPPTDLKVAVAAMTGAIGPLEVRAVPPAAGVTITAPTSLPARFTDDLTVTWTPLGHTRVLVELELGDATGAMMPLTVVCHAAMDGTLTIPARSVMPPNPLRLTVTQYVEAASTDATGGIVGLLVERGSAIEAM